jgi:WD40 repeat protein
MSDTDSPYVGLIPYTAEHAPYFFGREREQEIIIANLMASRLTLLYGTSGVGKSSVLNVGVVHHLNRQAQESRDAGEEPEFVAIIFNSWRDEPLTALTRSIYKSLAQLLPERFGEPEPPPSTFNDSLLAWTQRDPDGAHADLDIYIILDQFEEYFLYHSREDGENSFAVEFPRAVNNPKLRVNFLISIREDALAKLDFFKGRINNLFENRLCIRHLDSSAARSAIVGPLRTYNTLHAGGQEVIEPECDDVATPPAGEQVCIETPLVEAVIEQVKVGKVALKHVGRGGAEDKTASPDAPVLVETPFLQMVLSRLWEEERATGSRVLRLETLTNLGGAQRIVHAHLDEAMKGLSADEREIAAAIFPHLVTPSGAKFAYTLTDLVFFARHASEARHPRETIEALLNKLSNYPNRIIRPVATLTGRPGDLHYEIFHDVLGAAILHWQEHYEQDKKEKELRLERERAEKLERAMRLAHSRELAASAMSQLMIDPELGLMLAVLSAEVSQTAEARDALIEAVLESRVRATLNDHSDGVLNAVFDPSGELIVTAAFDGIAIVREAATGQIIATLRGHKGGLHDAQFSPDGKLVVTASFDRTAIVWEIETGRALLHLKGHKRDVARAVFSPDGQLILTASYDGTSRLWHAGTGETVKILKTSARHRIKAAAFSPDGKLIITASDDGAARIWDVDAGKIKRVLRGHTDSVYDAQFSHDGELIVTASTDRTARLWKTKTGKVTAELRGHTGGISRACFSADDRLVITASFDGTARLWDTSIKQEIITLRAPGGTVNAASFSPDNRWVLTASDDWKTRRWQVAPERQLDELRGHTAEVNSAAFSHDGKFIVTSSADKNAVLWDVSNGRAHKLFELSGHTERIMRAAFNRDGSLIATASADKTARVWDKETGRQLLLLKRHKQWVLSAEFSPDGKFLVTTSADRTSCLWDVKTGELLKVFERRSRWIDRAAFSPDGKLVVTSCHDGYIRIWDSSSWQQVNELHAHPSRSVYSAVFSHDSRHILTASDDGTASIFDLTGKAQPVVLSGHTGRVNDAAFSPDDSLIVTAGDDCTARLWDRDTRSRVWELRGHKGPVRSANFSPDGRVILTAGDDHTARTYDCTQLCDTIEGLLSLAHTRITRDMTQEERAKYLHVSA